jgi:ubiquinone/menaquinone biosynthesis C-methylase UbiE
VRESRKSEGQRPEIQSYRHLAGGYDEHRYVNETDVLTETWRREAMTNLLPDRCGRALDVACGTGRGVLVLSERSGFVVGLDGTLEMLRAAQAKSTGRAAGYCNANAAQMPFGDATFDVVTCLNFLHLFPGKMEKGAFVSEIARVLKPGGTAILEFDNALHGLLLGPIRKYFGTDIGYDWPWTVRASLPRASFGRRTIVGTNIPYIWRVRWLHGLERTARWFPVKYLANRLLIAAVRK